MDFALNRDIEAEIELQHQQLERDPNWSRGHYNLGVLYYSQGRLIDAIREYLTAIECDPSDGQPLAKLGELYVGLGDYQQAVTYAMKAAERGETGLLASFRKYPEMAGFIEKVQAGS